VRVSNQAARRLYEGLGFQITRPLSAYYRTPTEDGLLMQWSAQQPPRCRSLTTPDQGTPHPLQEPMAHDQGNPNLDQPPRSEEPVIRMARPPVDTAQKNDQLYDHNDPAFQRCFE